MRYAKLLVGSLVLFVLGLGVLGGCSEDTNTPAGTEAAAVSDVKVSVNTSALESSDITRVELNVYSSQAAYDPALPTEDPDEEFPIPVEVKLVDGTWTGTAFDVPVSTGDPLVPRYFVANAYDTENNLIFTGVLPVVVIVGDEQDVIIVLHEQNPHLSVDNTAPIISGLVISDEQIAVGELASLLVTAIDPDTRSGLTFNWDFSPTGGTLVAPDPVQSPNVGATQDVDWSSNTAGVYNLTITVSDGLLSTSVSIPGVFTVFAVSDVGVTLDINAAPVIESIIATPALAATGARVALNLTVTDSDALSYLWSTTCIGNFYNTGATDVIEDPSYDIGVYESPASCTFTVAVTDTAGNVSSGSVTIFIGPPGFTPTYTDEVPSGGTSIASTRQE